MVITFHSEVRFRRIIYQDTHKIEQRKLSRHQMIITFLTEVRFRRIIYGTPEIELRKLSRNSNCHNFSLRGLLQAHNISTRPELNNGSSRDIQMVITFNSEVVFRHIKYRDARNWTTEAPEKFKWSLLFTRRSDSGASHIETLAIEQGKLSRYSNSHNF